MKKYFSFILIICITLSPLSAHSEEADNIPKEHFTPVLFPRGDIDSGKEAFKKLQCYTCHTVKDHSDLPQPISKTKGPELGNLRIDSPIGWLLDSIVSPSHSVRLNTTGGPDDNKLSAMGDFTEVMTVRELIDLVTFLKYSKDK